MDVEHLAVSSVGWNGDVTNSCGLKKNCLYWYWSKHNNNKNKKAAVVIIFDPEFRNPKTSCKSVL